MPCPVVVLAAITGRLESPGRNNGGDTEERGQGQEHLRHVRHRYEPASVRGGFYVPDGPGAEHTTSSASTRRIAGVFNRAGSRAETEAVRDAGDRDDRALFLSNRLAEDGSSVGVRQDLADDSIRYLLDYPHLSRLIGCFLIFRVLH